MKPSQMDRWVTSVRNRKGVALPLALFALVMLSGLLLAFLSMAGMEPTIAANLSDVTRARYAADAGIEWVFDRLVLQLDANNQACDWSCFLSKPGGITVSNQTFPGLTAGAGTFTVQVRNDNQAGDTALTGCGAPGSCLAETGNNVTDNNGVVIVTATGNLPNGMSRQIRVVVSRVPLNIPGAVTLPGAGTKVVLGGNAEITGNDTDPGSATKGSGSCAPSWAFASAPANEGRLEASIANPNANPVAIAQQLDLIEGRPQNPALPGEGLNTIAGDARLTSQAVTDFVNAVKGKAHVSLSAVSSPLEYEDGIIGTTCAANWDSQLCWGTKAKPKVVYVKAQTPNVNDPFDPASVYVEDIKGAGILIVEDGTLWLKGVTGWEGIIIVTGRNVGLNICCGQSHDVWGGIIVNETLATDPAANTDFRAWQHSNLYYSCEAIRNALSSRVTTRVTSWREL